MKAPKISRIRSATSIPALVLLGAVCGSAIASTEIQAPCPESDQSDALHAMLASDDAKVPLADDGDEKTESADETVESPVSDSSVRSFTTQMPGVSANDMPRFRRHMFRTDI